MGMIPGETRRSLADTVGTVMSLMRSIKAIEQVTE